MDVSLLTMEQEKPWLVAACGLIAVVLTLQCASEPPGTLVKTQVLTGFRAHPQASNSVGPE